MSDRQYDNDGRGGIWKRTAKSGMEYMSGYIEHNGEKINFCIFDKKERTNDNQPHFDVVRNEPKDGQNANTAQSEASQWEGREQARRAVQGDDIDLSEIPF